MQCVFNELLNISQLVLEIKYLHCLFLIAEFKKSFLTIVNR